MITWLQLFFERSLERSRRIRTRYLRTIVLPLHSFGITPDILTSLSLLSGVAATSLLFTSHTAFVVFGMLHLLFDVFDGVLAREVGPTRFGAYFDTVADNIFVVLLLGAAALFFDKTIYGVAAIAYFIHMLGYWLSRLKSPVVFVRTVTLALFFFRLYYSAALVVSVASAYGLLLQTHYQLTRFKRTK